MVSISIKLNQSALSNEELREIICQHDTKIKVVDSIMGSGKTTMAINMINNSHFTNFIYITPYLDEVERIKQSCHEPFHEPKIYSKNGETMFKLDSLHQLLTDNKNIATTHALFKMANETTKDLIASSDYILILDEVMEVVKQLNISKHDIQMLLNDKWIINNNGLVEWNSEKEEQERYTGRFQEVKQMATNKNLILHNGSMLIWEFPHEIFKLFKEVYILTYLFDAQIQKYYYDMHDIKYDKYMSVYNENTNTYELIDYDSKIDIKIRKSLKDKIHIYDGSLNNIGEDETALSKSWYTKKNYLHKKLKNNLLNYFQNIMKSKSDDNLWTTFKNYQHKLKGKGYTKGFISSTLRATNEYKHKTVLAYTINKYLQPVIKDYFYSHNVGVNEDLYAISELIQWIWRSAIREGNEIHIYLPSRRMRELLIDWIDGIL